eukprot:15434575-Alexandrium_andersonii.AAC.1
MHGHAHARASYAGHNRTCAPTECVCGTRMHTQVMQATTARARANCAARRQTEFEVRSNMLLATPAELA